MFCIPCGKKEGFRMHNSDAISLLNCVFNSISFLHKRGPIITFRKIGTFQKYGQHILLRFFFKLLFSSSRSPQTMGTFLDISIAGPKCLCACGKVVLWSKHFDIKMLVPMFYSKLCSHINIYICIYPICMVCMVWFGE